MGPRLAFGLGHARALTRHRRVIHSPRAASLPHRIAQRIVLRWNGRGSPRPTRLGVRTTPRNSSEAMFRLRRNDEFALTPRRRHFASETAKHRGFCEATSLTTLGPHVQNTHNPGDLQGDLESPCTRFLSSISLTRVKEIDNNPITVRKLCSHNLSHLFRLFFVPKTCFFPPNMI